MATTPDATAAEDHPGPPFHPRAVGAMSDTAPDLPTTGTCHHCGADDGQPCATDCPARLLWADDLPSRERVRRHATGRTEQVTRRSYFAARRRWYAPWSRRRAMGFILAGGNFADATRRFDEFAADLRRDAMRPGFLDGFVEWVTVRDHWSGAPDEDLNWIWRTKTPVEVRRLTIAADLTEVDTGAVIS